MIRGAIPDTKETAPAPSEALFAELSLVDQTACRHTARLDAVVPNFSALETPARSVQGFFLSYRVSYATGIQRRRLNAYVVLIDGLE
jgi:hypothetical protein